MKRYNLMAERIRSGFTPQYMAEALNISCSAYYKYEGGQANIPLNRAQQISVILNCSLDTLFPVLNQDSKESEV